MSLFTPSTLTLQLAEHIRAAFSGLYVLTHEPDEALAEIRRLCIDERWNLATWDVLSGLSVASGPSTAVGDPLAAVNALAGMAGPDETTLLVLRNFHRYIGGAEVVQALEQQLVLGRVRPRLGDRLAKVLGAQAALSPLLGIPRARHQQPRTRERRELRREARQLLGEPARVAGPVRDHAG